MVTNATPSRRDAEEVKKTKNFHIDLRNEILNIQKLIKFAKLRNLRQFKDNQTLNACNSDELHKSE